MSFVPAPPPSPSSHYLPPRRLPTSVVSSRIENRGALTGASVEKVSSFCRCQNPFPPAIGRKNSFSAVREKSGLEERVVFPEIPGSSTPRNQYVCKIPKEFFLLRISSPESPFGRFPFAPHGILPMRPSV